MVSVSCVSCVLRRVDHTSKEVLPNVACLIIVKKAHRGDLGPLSLLSHKKKTNKDVQITAVKIWKCILRTRILKDTGCRTQTY